MNASRDVTERHLIGAIILMGFVPGNVKVQPKHFGDERHARIWQEILKRQRFDAVLLAGWLEAAGFDGPFALIGSMLDDVPLVEYIDDYAKRVIDCWVDAKLEGAA